MSPTRDAFGRPIVPPGAQPATGLEPGWSETGGPQRPHGRLCGGLTVVSVLLVLLGLVLTDAIDLRRDDRGAAVADVASPTGDEVAEGGYGLDGQEGSLLTSGGTRWGLARLSRELRRGERLIGVTISDDTMRIETTGARDQPDRTLKLSADGTLEEQAGPTNDEAGFPIDVVDETAPQRLLAAVARRRHGPPASPLLILAGGERHGDGPFGWSAYLDWTGSAPQERWDGDLHGRHVVRGPQPTS